jgi:hypothetical protein
MNMNVRQSRYAAEKSGYRVFTCRFYDAFGWIMS